MAHKLPIVIVASEKIEVARQLIVLANDSMDAAHKLITKAGKQIEREKKASVRLTADKGKSFDTGLLLLAAAIQRHDRCSRRSALLQATRLQLRDEEEIANTLRRLQARSKVARWQILSEVSLFLFRTYLIGTNN